MRTWDYFYNSGGWDDYPPQVHVHKHGLEASVTPVINTAQAILTAKILRMAARALGEPEKEYDDDIAMFSHALHIYAWDESSGYFGYVCHDNNGRPTGIMRHESGANYDMGLDGAYPLVAGICTQEQEERFAGYLMANERMWSRCGVSTVDQSAPYYKADGYWNGAVWMPHQWLFWRALLDLGRADAAHCIAATALDVWKNEVETSYNCFEHFIVESGRGAGWHQFGGLSAPVLCWYGALPSSRPADDRAARLGRDGGVWQWQPLTRGASILPRSGASHPSSDRRHGARQRLRDHVERAQRALHGALSGHSGDHLAVRAGVRHAGSLGRIMKGAVHEQS